MEFKEFNNPEERDYDIRSSLNSNNVINTTNYYADTLVDLIGILEDVTDEELQENYGISIKEYLNPNKETIEKVKEYLGTKKHR